MKENHNYQTTSIQNVLHLLRPILEKKELIGKLMTVTELAKICRNHKRRLPFRPYLAKDLARELQDLTGGFDMFAFEDLDVLIFEELDLDALRRINKVQFLYSISKEQLNSPISTQEQPNEPINN